MNLFELIIFLLICAGLGFLGHLVSPHYGWWVSALLFVLVFIRMLIGNFREAIRESRKRHKGERQLKKAVLIIVLVASFIGLFPLSFRVADPFFTYPFHKDWPHAVLLIWPDHVEARWFDDVSEVSPRPKAAQYIFNVQPEREAWIKQQVRRLPSPSGDASWAIRVKQLSASRQQIQLELLGDGVSGLIYEAGPDEIVPLHSRLGGPGGALVILAVNLVLWGGSWLLLWAVNRVMERRKQSPSVSVA